MKFLRNMHKWRILPILFFVKGLKNLLRSIALCESERKLIIAFINLIIVFHNNIEDENFRQIRKVVKVVNFYLTFAIAKICH